MLKNKLNNKYTQKYIIMLSLLSCYRYPTASSAYLGKNGQTSWPRLEFRISFLY